MTAAIKERPSVFKHKNTIATSVAAGVGTSALVLGGPIAAQALASHKFSEGHVDVVHVGVNDLDDPTALTLAVLNEGDPSEDEGIYPAADSEFLVPNTPTLGGYVLPEDQAEADLSGVLYAGFSGSEDLYDSFAFFPNDTITITLDDWHYDPAPGQSQPSSFSIVQQSTSTTFFSPTDDTEVFTLDTSSLPEAFHQHATWTFAQPGTYTFEFTPSGGGLVDAPLTPYTFVVG
jgi:surface-anchored protein